MNSDDRRWFELEGWHVSTLLMLPPLYRPGKGRFDEERGPVFKTELEAREWIKSQFPGHKSASHDQA